MEWAPWAEQSATWPVSGSSILAAHDDAHITVYQAYNDAIADAAVRAQHLCVPAFRLGRMSWIKTNFLWMAARSGWGIKPNQTRVLAITLRRLSSTRSSRRPCRRASPPVLGRSAAGRATAVRMTTSARGGLVPSVPLTCWCSGTPTTCPRAAAICTAARYSSAFVGTPSAATHPPDMVADRRTASAAAMRAATA